MFGGVEFRGSGGRKCTLDESYLKGQVSAGVSGLSAKFGGH